jgi:ubiquitin carboxyl-terminal hydrolase L5
MADKEKNNWCTIESDPGVFTEMIEKMGVKDVQVEELYALDDDLLNQLQPIYGLIFLFKWRSEKDEILPETHYDFFFAQQLVTNACATQAILNVLLNTPGVHLGSELAAFRENMKGRSSEERGVALGKLEGVRQVHNSFGRPEGWTYDSKSAKDDDDVFHFIAYMPVGDKLYELDGLKSGPIKHGDCSQEDWVAAATPVIQKRIARYAASEIRFNLMAIVRDRRVGILQDLKQAKQEVRLTCLALGQPDPYAADGPLDAAARAPTGSKEALSQQLNLAKKRVREAEESQQTEEVRRRSWQTENTRRKHNFTPFLIEMLKCLRDKDALLPLVKKAREAPAAAARGKAT